MTAGAADFPLLVSESGRYLEDARGQPFYFVADTQWPLFWHYTFEEACEIIDDRAARGFTAILVIAAEKNQPNRAGNAPFADLVGLEAGEAYFAHADRVLDHAASRGLAVYLGPLWWKYYFRRASAEGIAAFGRWIGRRWRHRANLIWVLGGDLWFRRRDRRRFRALAEAIREGGAAQVMSWHPRSGVPWRNFGRSSGDYLHDEPWLAFNSVQAHASGGRMVERMLADHARTPTKPTILIEAWYFWTRLWKIYPIHQQALGVRRSHYQARLGGGSFGEGYGAYPFWHWRSTPEEWRRALRDQPAATQIATHMRACLEAVPWWRLEPDRRGAILVGGRGRSRGWDRAVAGGAPDRSVAVVYLPSHRAVEIDLGWFAGDVRARWFDPTDGSYSEATPHANRSVERFHPPHANRAGDEDFVLVLEAE